MKELRVGVLGLGTVGRGVVTLLQTHQKLLEQRAGMPVRLVRVATLYPERIASVDWNHVELTDDVGRVVHGNDIDVVAELIGGVDVAEGLIRDALNNGKHVVTANKALIAERGFGLFETARKNQCELGFEAAVAGAVPVIKVIKESLAANRIEWIYGILNGTCNYILTEMREKGLPFDEVLRDAQQKGFAEADPAFDIDGIDTAHKLAILAAIAFGTRINFHDIHVEGIRHISKVDIAWAKEMNYRIKLLAIAKQQGQGLELRVQPTLVPAGSMVAKVEEVFNAVFVRGDFSGTTMYYGSGAGSRPTASAVVADMVDIARNARSGAQGRVSALSVFPEYLQSLPVHSIDNLQGGYYLRLSVVDRPGVLAEITTILAQNQISIDAIHQKGRSPMEAVPLVIVTHRTTESHFQNSLVALEKLESVLEKPRFIRIETNLA